MRRSATARVKLTNLDKVFFPQQGLTKGELIEYYLDLAPCLLHHVRKRPMQMLRYPDGVDGFRFYQEIKAVEAVHASAATCEESDVGYATIRMAEVTLDLLFERYRARLVNRNRLLPPVSPSDAILSSTTRHRQRASPPRRAADVAGRQFAGEADRDTPVFPAGVTEPAAAL